MLQTTTGKLTPEILENQVSIIFDEDLILGTITVEKTLVHLFYLGNIEKEKQRLYKKALKRYKIMLCGCTIGARRNRKNMIKKLFVLLFVTVVLGFNLSAESITDLFVAEETAIDYFPASNYVCINEYNLLYAGNKSSIGKDMENIKN